MTQPAAVRSHHQLHPHHDIYSFSLETELKFEFVIRHMILIGLLHWFLKIRGGGDYPQSSPFHFPNVAWTRFDNWQGWCFSFNI